MRLGIKFASCKNEDGGVGIEALAKAELYCIETGEFIRGVRNITVDYGVDGEISADIQLIVSEVKGTDEPLYAERAKLPRK